MNYKHSLKISAALGAFVLGASAFASGFEKGIPFGGATSGVAGIGVSYMTGSQALFFNPAGLVGEKAGAQDVSLNVSPTFPSFKEAIDNNGDTQSSRSSVVTPFSLIYGATVNDKIGFGIGGYTSAGTAADFTNESVGAFHPESNINLMVNEVAAGVGYKVMDNLKIGASYRVVAVRATLDVVEAAAGGAAVFTSSNTGLKDTEWTGYKLGAQYKLNDKWDLGLTYRSGVNFKAKGIQAISGPQSVAPQGVTVSTMLPPSTTLGASWAITETWKAYAEYAFTQYSMVTNLAVNTQNGMYSGPLQLAFKDEHALRVAGEYKGWMMPIRFGYAYTSQVTDKGHMLAGLVPPGPASTLTVGTGQAFTLGGQAFRADGGLEYTWVNGSSNSGAYPSALVPAPAYTNGSNNVSLLGVHLGVTYMF